ncbi:7-carboxy-7-deazaguanine synthase [Telmatospirillum sp. J64-1]|uniref:7-carboxy-7-deazaguanine synthase n=1 Tax=Telmatospirillum sp. J64-1 TaxID=2502183 RepID=UPI00115C8BFA|nr:7-carboxy-7-deazaguanine synthase [Telmatospirillum sp. J64-1]
MAYSVKEIFYTLQGEGAQAGRPAVFCRFSGCNLWTGREEDRAEAVCRFCDTDFVGMDGVNGGRFATAQDLARAVAAQWPQGAGGRPYVVCTGGEPLLQLDEPLIQAFHDAGFEIAIETNGTKPVPPGIDWVCVSPKGTAPLAVEGGDELKLVYPQEDARPEAFAGLNFRNFFLQPMDSPQRAQALQEAIAYCLAHPQWRLSLQTHKLIGIP